ncbi:MAG: hypothetical protein ALAOOOJD_00061 [bacterium]|nr:hypothetical protein [bacterium]
MKQFGHITTGFLGTPLISHVLTRYGYLELAYKLLIRQEYPSWLYPIRMGATTIWERWDGIKPDHSFQDRGMNSFNHYAYGAIGEWMYRVVAGIEIDSAHPGYKHVLIQPHPGGELTSVRATHQSLFGEIASAWELAAGKFILHVSLPPNTMATVRLPDAKLATVTESGKLLEKTPAVTQAKQNDNAVELEIGSGRYRFEYTME